VPETDRRIIPTVATSPGLGDSLGHVSWTPSTSREAAGGEAPIIPREYRYHEIAYIYASVTDRWIPTPGFLADGGKGVRNLAPGNLSESSRFRENGGGYRTRYAIKGHVWKPARRKMEMSYPSY